MVEIIFRVRQTEQMVKINKTTSKEFRELIFCEEHFHSSEKSEGIKVQTKCITRPIKSFADTLMSQSELAKQLNAEAGDKRGKHRAN